jgi:high frequency lysogenization protein
MNTPSPADRNRQKALALAGIFQSAAVVQHLARTGEFQRDAFECSISSVFVLDPPAVEDVYADLRALRLGIDVAIDVLRGRETQKYSETIRYSLGLLHVERSIRHNRDMLAVLRSRLEQLQPQLQHFESLSHPTVVTRLAQLYLDTAGTLPFRIQVKGDPRHLQGEETAHRVRAMFLAGVRAAILWRQVGGSRLDFFFKKSALIAALESLRKDAALG